MELFAIQEISSGNFIPEPRSVGEHAYTRVEPTDKGVPRLFKHRNTAKRAMYEWLKGEAFANKDWDINEFTGASYLLTCGTEIEPKTNRSKTNMRVVKILLTVEISDESN